MRKLIIGLVISNAVSAGIVGVLLIAMHGSPFSMNYRWGYAEGRFDERIKSRTEGDFYDCLLRTSEPIDAKACWSNVLYGNSKDFKSVSNYDWPVDLCCMSNGRVDIANKYSRLSKVQKIAQMDSAEEMLLINQIKHGSPLESIPYHDYLHEQLRGRCDY